MMDLVQETKDWIAAPFKENMDLWHFLALAIAIWTAIYLWARFINRIA